MILYVDMVVFRELELQDVAKPKLAEERRARDIKEVPLIVAKVTDWKYKRENRTNGAGKGMLNGFARVSSYPGCVNLYRYVRVFQIFGILKY